MKIAIIGLGYVGLPLALEFSKVHSVLGFDVSARRIHELKKGIDKNHELDVSKSMNRDLTFSNDVSDLRDLDTYIITVPTPIDETNRPDFTYLKDASHLVGSNMPPGAVVIFESTVFPGATEMHCIPVLEEVSNLKYNEDFFVGYSPERINPGDKTRDLTTIKKITSGSTPETADFVDKLYKDIIVAGTFKASSIKVAEAAKVFENTQRDVNIALINEFSRILKHLDLDTQEVLNAAATKWNFHDYKPGLVGGHCIGVDPYYLIHSSTEAGYFPNIIHTARKLNEQIPLTVAEDVINLVDNTFSSVNVKILVVGLTFKANCADIRNSKIIDMVQYLQAKSSNVFVVDELIDPVLIEEEYKINATKTPVKNKYDVIIFAVEHDYILERGWKYWKQYMHKTTIIIDLKTIFPKSFSNYRM